MLFVRSVGGGVSSGSVSGTSWVFRVQPFVYSDTAERFGTTNIFQMHHSCSTTATIGSGGATARHKSLTLRETSKLK